METIELQSSPLNAFRRGSLEVPKSIVNPASSVIRRISLSTRPSPRPQKTVALNLVTEVRYGNLQRSFFYHLHTAYLFAAKDVKTILVPQTLFGLLNAYACIQRVSGPSHASQASAQAVFARAPLVILWISLNLVPFCIDNQRQPGSIAEDKVNKPSRPLPAKRLTAEEAWTWMLALYTAALILSLYIGGTSMCVVLMGLGWLYNDCQMSEKGWVGRNFLTALGYAAFGVGALMVAMPVTSAGFSISKQTWLWVVILAGVIGTTGHLTDLADLEGDRLRGRKTAPIVLGEDAAKWTVCVPVAVWSVLCPWFCEARFLGFLLPAMIGGKIISRLLTKNTAAAHKQTFRLWNLWVAVLYFLPLLRSRS